jgi:hypothetical protein
MHARTNLNLKWHMPVTMRIILIFEFNLMQ